MNKSTMVDLIPELEKLADTPEKTILIEEAKAGEFHDYKNKKYTCGKYQLASYMKSHADKYPQDSKIALKIREDVINGEYDEIADEDDKVAMSNMIDENSSNPSQAKALKSVLGLTPEVQTVSLQDCVNKYLAGKTTTIYYSANTVWWTDDPNDLNVDKKSGLPLDVFGSPLFMTEGKSVGDWLNKQKIEDHEGFGLKENRVRNFMQAHAKNIVDACNKMPSRSFNLVANFKEFSNWCDNNIGGKSC